MPSQHPNVYFNSRLSPGLKTSLQKVLLNFRKEITLVSQSFYKYQISAMEYQGVDNLFSIIERTWLGIFNNALVRNSDIAVMQEFNVWNDEKNIGRCDLLFQLSIEEGVIDFITEGKSEEFHNDSNIYNSDHFLTKILDQAYSYYKEEKKYYVQDTRLMALVFSWIRNNDQLEKAKNLMNDLQESKLSNTDFISLYFGTKRGVFIYGKTLTVQDYEHILNTNET